ncbi:hypothetical protein ACWDU3_03675 [Streptomyces olivaceus]
MGELVTCVRCTRPWVSTMLRSRTLSVP